MPLYDMAQMTVALAPGTGSITLGAAAVADGITYLTFAAAGVQNNDVVSYRIADPPAWEIGRGAYTATGPILGRGLLKSSTGSLISASAAALVSIVALAEDFLPTIANGVAVTGTSVATATPLPAQDNEITNTASGTYVRITLATPGVPTILHNYSGNTIFVCPATPSGQINHLGLNVSYSMGDGTSMVFRCMTPTQWYSTSP
jgi:hypothetical protein